MELELNRIYNMDCLEGIRQLPTGSVHLTIADPPYFQGMTNNGKKASFVNLAASKPFYAELFREIGRVTATEGEVYWFCDWRSYAFYYPLFDAHIGAKNMIVWDKMSGPGNFYSFTHELIIFGAKGGRSKSGTNIWRSNGFNSGAKHLDGEKVHEAQG